MFAATIAVLFTGCSKDESDYEFLGTRPGMVNMTSAGETKTAKVFFTNSVKISVADAGKDWCSVTPNRATASHRDEVDSLVITIISQPNPKTSKRSVDILLVNPTIDSVLPVVQAGAEQ